MTPVELVAFQFNQQSELPGVIVASDQKFLGMISRNYFHEQMSSPYGKELFMKRPIEYFLKANKSFDNCLILSAEEKIHLAVQIALNRSDQTIYEPLVVKFLSKKNSDFCVYFLLTFQTLILAQSHSIKEVNNELSRYKNSAKNCLMQLQSKQYKLKQHTEALKVQKQEILERNKLLEKKHNELISQSKQIKNLNQKLKEITGFISQEGRKAFSATFEGVQKINKNMNKIVNIGQLFTNDLKLINSTSNKIERISKQAEHLAIQASIVASNSGSQLSGFSHITNEIGKLVSETSEAGREMNEITNKLIPKISELNNLAETGKNIAQSLVENNQRSEKTLDELEALIQQLNLDTKPVNFCSIEDKNRELYKSQTFLTKPETDKEKLVEKINSTLDKKNSTL
ncbi:MAG: hypothetical protein F6K40_18795 [Okeania sp. SIO3I5]|nr:hypothetical protein [Okeania sp. SIO3I5]